MKFCPMCRRAYDDETLSFCLDDGTPLVKHEMPNPTQNYTPAATQKFDAPRNFAAPSQPNFQFNAPPPRNETRRGKFWIIPMMIAVLLALIGGAAALVLVVKNKNKNPDSEANLRTVASNVSASNNSRSNSSANVQPSVSPTTDKPDSWKLVGTWEADVKEEGVKMHIVYTFASNGTSKAFFKTSNGQTGRDPGTWQFSDGILYEKFSNGVSGKSSIKWLDDDTVELTIIDNGTPSYSGVKRIYHRKK